MHKERTCRPSTSPSIHPSRARGPKRVWAASSTADVRAREDSGPASKTRLPRTSKPCWNHAAGPDPQPRRIRKAYRPSARTRRFRFVESLYRRVRQAALYQINSVVDANNLVSLETGFSLGSYDTARIGADIVFRLGKAGEVYPGIGKDDIALENMPLLADGEGAFGSPTSDSTRAMITQETRSCLTVVFSFSARSKLEEALALTVKRFASMRTPRTRNPSS
ncbi:MAG: phenylalanine--tRNA ligase beta subunit-related protein [Bilophila wadsworthia]